MTICNQGGRKIFLPRQPDRGFVRRLKEYDAELEVWFNRVMGLWNIFRNGRLVMCVMNPDGSYRNLDERAMVVLKRGDAHMRGRAVFDEIERANRKAQEKAEENWHDYNTYAAKQLRKEFAKEADSIVGAINVPKEDLKIPDTEALRQRRQQRIASTHVNYRRKRVAPIPVAVPA